MGDFVVTGESTDNDGDGRDNNRPSSFRYTERFEEECGYYLSIGMTYHDYWDGDLLCRTADWKPTS